MTTAIDLAIATVALIIGAAVLVSFAAALEPMPWLRRALDLWLGEE